MESATVLWSPNLRRFVATLIPSTDESLSLFHWMLAEASVEDAFSINL